MAFFFFLNKWCGRGTYHHMIIVDDDAFNLHVKSYEHGGPKKKSN